MVFAQLVNAVREIGQKASGHSERTWGIGSHSIVRSELQCAYPQFITKDENGRHPDGQLEPERHRQLQLGYSISTLVPERASPTLAITTTGTDTGTSDLT